MNRHTDTVTVVATSPQSGGGKVVLLAGNASPPSGDLPTRDRLVTRGFSVEVVDVRTLAPLDVETILASVRKTSRAIVVYEDNRTYGAGAEIAATIDAVLQTLDGRLRFPFRFTTDEERELLAFLRALTDPAARDLSAIAPARVPSGLPVNE